MKDYSSWSQKMVSVASLQLDPENPRIPPRDAAFSQRDLIAELVEHDDVYELAKNIVNNGYWPVESLVGLRYGKDQFVLEGNRRLAALKLLLNPDQLAPASSLRKFKKLADVVSVPVAKVPVLFAPSREDAAPLIMARHTKSQVESWTPLMQARFYANLRKEGVSVAQLASQYGVAASDILYNLRVDETYRAARSLSLPEDVATVVNDPRSFQVSTLERILNVPKARELLGIEYGRNDGKMTIHADPSKFKKVFASIVTDVANGKADTRKLNTSGSIAEYVEKKIGSGTVTSKGSAFTADDLAAEAAAQSTGSSPAAAPGAKRPKPRKGTRRRSSALLSRELKCNLGNVKIREVCDELRKLDVDRFPNTCAVMLRVLLDISVSDFMDRTGRMQPLVARLNKKKQKRPGWSPTLNQMLGNLANEADLDIPPGAKKQLNKVVSNKDSLVSIDHLLDGVAHSRFALPNARDLRNLYDTVEPLLKLTLDPSTDPGRVNK